MRADLHPGDKVKLTGTGSEGVVVTVKGNAVEVNLARGIFTTSVYHVLHVEPAKREAGTRPAVKKKTAKGGTEERLVIRA